MRQAYIAKHGYHQVGDLHKIGVPDYVDYICQRSFKGIKQKADNWNYDIFLADLIDEEKGIFKLRKCIRRFKWQGKNFWRPEK